MTLKGEIERVLREMQVDEAVRDYISTTLEDRNLSSDDIEQSILPLVQANVSGKCLLEYAYKILLVDDHSLERLRNLLNQISQSTAPSSEPEVVQFSDVVLMTSNNNNASSNLRPPETTSTKPVNASKKGKEKRQQSKKQSKSSPASSPQINSTTPSNPTDEQIEELNDLDDWSSTWERVKLTGERWGGWGKGGRGVQRNTWQPKDVSVEGVTMAYQGTELLNRTTLKLVHAHRYGLIGMLMMN